MTTIQINNVTLSAHAGANMAECFPAETAKRRDRSRTLDAKREAQRRAMVRRAKRAGLAS